MPLLTAMIQKFGNLSLLKGFINLYAPKITVV